MSGRYECSCSTTPPLITPLLHVYTYSVLTLPWLNTKSASLSGESIVVTV